MTITDVTPEATLVKLPADVAMQLINASTIVCDEETLADALHLLALQAPTVVHAWLVAYDDDELRDLLRLGARRAGG